MAPPDYVSVRLLISTHSSTCHLTPFYIRQVLCKSGHFDHCMMTSVGHRMMTSFCQCMMTSFCHCLRRNENLMNALRTNCQHPSLEQRVKSNCDVVHYLELVVSVCDIVHTDTVTTIESAYPFNV